MTGPDPRRALRLVVMGTGPFAVPMFHAVASPKPERPFHTRALAAAGASICP